MNECIKELLYEAGATYGGKHYLTGETILYTEDVDCQKFAKLIVRECIKTITEYDLSPGHSAKWEDIYDIHTRLLQDLGEYLKEHFGVK